MNDSINFNLKENEPHSKKSITSFNSITEKIKCKYWDKCKITNMNHIEKYYHPCRHGERCKCKGNEVHINRFQHPCYYGHFCVKQFDKEHCKYFYHSRQGCHSARCKKPL